MHDAFWLSEDERQTRDLARAISRERVAPLAAQVDEAELYPAESLHHLAQAGLMGLYVPESYGGAGLGALAFCCAVEEIAWACASTAVIYLVQYAAGYPIVSHGTDAQKRRYLPRLAAGEITAALSISEPGAGSDAASMTTTAVRKGDRYLLNGSKMWVTNGSHAGVITLFATVDRARGHKGVTAFLVEPTFPGFALGKLERKMGIRGSPTVAIHLTDCEVPVDNRLGEEGEGFRVALGALDRSRPAVGGQAVGIAQAALDAAVGYARERRQFDRPIAEFQGIQFMLADMPCRCTPRGCWSTTPPPSWTAAPPVRRSSRPWPSASPPTRRCAWPSTRSRSSGAMATRASIRSSASCATPRSRRSTRAPTRSSASSWPASS